MEFKDAILLRVLKQNRLDVSSCQTPRYRKLLKAAGLNFGRITIVAGHIERETADEMFGNCGCFRKIWPEENEPVISREKINTSNAYLSVGLVSTIWSQDIPAREMAVSILKIDNRPNFRGTKGQQGGAGENKKVVPRY